MKTDAGKWVFEPFDLPIFEKPQIEWWPSKMTWDDAMRAFDPQRKEYMRTHYSARRPPPRQESRAIPHGVSFRQPFMNARRKALEMRELAFGRQNWLQIERMSTREILLEVAERLPANATLVDAIYELEFRQAVEEGLTSLNRGERIPLEEARERIPQWILKSSSPTKP